MELMEISKIIIGLEVHIELKTKSKMFCSCSADHFGKEPNTQTCPVCLGLPGALPYPNKKAIEDTVLIGLSLGGENSKKSWFDRKNYFYPDLPKGYQISQYKNPLCVGGFLELDDGKRIGITRAHLEEDTAKLQHGTVEGEEVSLIDFNRSGVPLVEIVSEPDLSSSDEVKEYLEKLQQLVRYLGVSDADMEKGSMRCEPNVNIEIKDGDNLYRTPITELKNINSFRFAKRAIDYEVQRQFEEFKEKRETVTGGNKQTRGWDETKGVTVLQRQKEEAKDYRYFPEPDIPPIYWTDSDLESFKGKIKEFELPSDKKKRFIRQYLLSEYKAKILTDLKEQADYFEVSVKAGKHKNVLPEELSNVIINKRAKEGLSPEELIDFIVSSRQKRNVSDEEIDNLIVKHLNGNPELAKSYKEGKPQALGKIVGLIKEETGIVVSLDRIIKNIGD
ncbi:Asp-tRNA(Asn)/Glu-tRNA(Gln) amidotransferase subunit GatB [Patescibacteria group bacterium]|nr:Asp-tRNA(Asn)/Glu-tRNA(Gln) amidotransferase subunit GatB [Patescibacteria group bacterium]